MNSIYHRDWRSDRNLQFYIRPRTIVNWRHFHIFFSFTRLLMGCTKTILARISSLRASKKRDSEQLGAEIKREKESREGLWALTMGYYHRSRWYSYTNYGNDRSIPSSSLFFISLSLFFSCLPYTFLPPCARIDIGPSLHHEAVATLVHSRAISPVFLSYTPDLPLIFWSKT